MFLTSSSRSRAQFSLLRSRKVFSFSRRILTLIGRCSGTRFSSNLTVAGFGVFSGACVVAGCEVALNKREHATPKAIEAKRTLARTAKYFPGRFMRSSYRKDVRGLG